jgi:two-component system response regulator HydG
MTSTGLKKFISCLEGKYVISDTIIAKIVSYLAYEQAAMNTVEQLGTEARTELTGILEVIDAPAVALTLDYRILAANRAYREAYGDGQPIHDRACYEVSHKINVPCDRAGESCPLANCLTSGRKQRVLHLHHTPRGEEHVDVETYPVRDKNGEITYVIECMRETRTASSRKHAYNMVGRSKIFNRMLDLVNRAAPAETAVLLQGESGTGKELVARALHDNSTRANRPFVVVECSGLTESLFESELFGHERGAFTGAHARKIGLVEAADRGTLFLDEIGDVPLGLQVKLLRLLETGTFRRVGSVEPVHADFRLVTATHRNLKRMVSGGQFRRDLFYRISAFPIDLPPLRERRGDIPLLTESLLARISPKRRYQLSAEAMNYLQSHPFPGNIRELLNILERALLLADDDVIDLAHVMVEADAFGTMEEADESHRATPILPLAEVERNYLARVAREYPGDRDGLAEALGVSRRTLYRKLGSLR